MPSKKTTSGGKSGNQSGGNQTQNNRNNSTNNIDLSGIGGAGQQDLSVSTAEPLQTPTNTSEIRTNTDIANLIASIDKTTANVRMAQGPSSIAATNPLQATDIVATQINTQDVVVGLNQATSQIMDALNTVNSGLVSGLNTIIAKVESQDNFLSALEGYGEDTQIKLNELSEALNRMSLGGSATMTGISGSRGYSAQSGSAGSSNNMQGGGFNSTTLGATIGSLFGPMGMLAGLGLGYTQDVANQNISDMRLMGADAWNRQRENEQKQAGLDMESWLRGEKGSFGDLLTGWAYDLGHNFRGEAAYGSTATTAPINTGTSNPNASREDIIKYIRESAIARGIDPDIAVKVAESEGLGSSRAGWQSEIPNPSGPGGFEDSWGPFQLYKGGGLGNTFMDQTGMDPSDPSTWQAQIDFALNNAATSGWGPWKGWKGDPYAGLQGAQTVQSNTPQTRGIDASPISSEPTLGKDQKTARLIEEYGPNRPERPDQKLLDIVQQAATQAGMDEVTLTSGKGDYISPEGKAKGQKTTMHSTGLAVDIASSSFTSEEQKYAFIKAARALGIGGVGTYSHGGLHVDLGSQREWNWGKEDEKFDEAVKTPKGDAQQVSDTSATRGIENPMTTSMGEGTDSFAVLNQFLGNGAGSMLNELSGMISMMPQIIAPQISNISQKLQDVAGKDNDYDRDPSDPVPPIAGFFAQLIGNTISSQKGSNASWSPLVDLLS